MCLRFHAGVLIVLLITSKQVCADSPWLLIPTFTSNPKLGTSLGAIAGYLHKFDPKSQLSIFGVSAQYSSTDSLVAAAIARASFGEDQHRLMAVAAGGEIKNDYDDYLGTGMPLKSQDDIRAVIGRYLYRVGGDWFMGAQAIVKNYQIVGQTSLDEEALSILGLTGFESGASVRSSITIRVTFRTRPNVAGYSTSTTLRIANKSRAMTISTSIASTIGSTGRTALAMCSPFGKAINGP